MLREPRRGSKYYTAFSSLLPRATFSRRLDLSVFSPLICLTSAGPVQVFLKVLLIHFPSLAQYKQVVGYDVLSVDNLRNVSAMGLVQVLSDRQRMTHYAVIHLWHSNSTYGPKLVILLAQFKSTSGTRSFQESLAFEFDTQTASVLYGHTFSPRCSSARYYFCTVCIGGVLLIIRQEHVSAVRALIRWKFDHISCGQDVATSSAEFRAAQRVRASGRKNVGISSAQCFVLFWRNPHSVQSGARFERGLSKGFADLEETKWLGKPLS